MNHLKRYIFVLLMLAIALAATFLSAISLSTIPTGASSGVSTDGLATLSGWKLQARDNTDLSLSTFNITEPILNSFERVHGDDTDASCDPASDIICETTTGSPFVEDVLQGAEFFSKIKKKLDCRQRHKSGSWCTTMQLGEKSIMEDKEDTIDVTGNWARFSICDSEHLPDWHTIGEIRCRKVGGLVRELVEKCSVDGKVGGRIILGHKKCKIWGMELRVSMAEKKARNW